MPSLAEIIAKTKKHNFGPNDSYIASTINHPVGAVGRLADWIAGRVNQAGFNPNKDMSEDYPFKMGAYYAPDKRAQAAFDIAGLAMGGSMPFAPKSAGGTLGTFIGPKAATWDTEKANLAAKLLDSGVSPEQVWQQHMIGRMPDNSLFSEIDDSVATLNLDENKRFSNSFTDLVARRLKNDNKELSAWNRSIDNSIVSGDGYNGVPLDVALTHYNLRGAYPDINPDVKLAWNPSYGGSYGGNTISIGELGSSKLSTTLHELQHAIQRREGWATGGSPEGMAVEYSNARKNWDFFTDAKMLMNEALKNHGGSLDNALKDARLAGFDDLSQEHIDAIMRMGEKGIAKKAMEAEEALKELASPFSQQYGDMGHNLYKRLTGEAQARATQDRLNMNMQQRRENYPLAGDKLSDIPLSQLIYRYGDNGPNMAIEAWHGSPHKFDAFDMSKIGTGEGA